MMATEVDPPRRRYIIFFCFLPEASSNLALAYTPTPKGGMK